MPTLGLEDISELTGVAAGIAVAAAGAAVVNVVGAAFDELVDVLFFMLLVSFMPFLLLLVDVYLSFLSLTFFDTNLGC